MKMYKFTTLIRKLYLSNLKSSLNNTFARSNLAKGGRGVNLGKTALYGSGYNRVKNVKNTAVVKHTIYSIVSRWKRPEQIKRQQTQTGSLKLWQRVNAVAIAVVLFATLAVPAFYIFDRSSSYNLADDLYALLGSPTKGYGKQMSYDSKDDAYVFNQQALNKMSGDPIEQLISKVGAGNESSLPLYGASIARDSERGMKFYDTQLETGFTMTPLFETNTGKQDDGHVVFPLREYRDAYLAYTLKSNGVKEDIVLSEPVGDELVFNYDLDLGEALEARLLEDGSLGVYSADPALFGDVSFGSDADKEQVLAARTNGEKTHLAFVIPRPVIFETVDGNVREASEGRAHFTYQDGTLTVRSSRLDKLSYPVSIDPSVVVTSSDDFATGNNEGGVSFDQDTISRSSPSGGSTGAWSSTTSLGTARQTHASAVYNGYMYVFGGYDDNGTITRFDSVEYAPINGDGTLGAWATTTSLPNINNGLSAVVYNGYMYILGGWDGSSTFGDVYYVLINGDGTLGSWSATESLTTPRRYHEAVAHNGYIYVLGGQNASNTRLNDVQYAEIQADGTLGAWAGAGAKFTNARHVHTAVAYNDHLYIAGGSTSGGLTNNVQYASINQDGTINAWRDTASLVTARSFHSMAADGGYLYVTGGNSNLDSTEYAQIKSDGSLGEWIDDSSSFTTARGGHTSVVDNGNIYIVGGGSTGGGTVPAFNDVQYTKINPAGVIESYQNVGTFTDARFGHTSVVHDNNLYIMGGANGSNTIRWATIGEDGTFGSWNSASLPVSQNWHAAVAYNGYMYISGGLVGGYTNNVYYSSINNDGTIGSWSLTTGLNGARAFHNMHAYQGFMYVTGGMTSSNNYFNVEYASINNDGTIGSWSTVSSGFATDRRQHASLIYNGTMYIIGGYDGATNLDDVQYASIDSNGDITNNWTSGTNLSSARFDPGVVAYKGFLYTAGGNDGTQLDTTELVAINPDGSIESWEETSSFSNPREGHTMELYGERLYIAGGWNGSTSYNDVQAAKINNGGSGAINAWQNNADAENLEQSIEGHWEMNGNANDSTANNNHGTVVNGASLTADRYGNSNSAYYFDGTDQYIYTNDLNNTELDFTTDYTISVWANLESFENLASNCGDDRVSIVSKTAGYPYTNGNWEFIGTTPGSTNYLQYRHSSPDGIRAVGATLDTNQWYHLAASYNKSEETITLFVNGEIAGTVTTDGYTLRTVEDGVVRFGGNGPNCSNDFMTGSVDDVRIYNRALAEDEIQQMHAVGSSMDERWLHTTTVHDGYIYVAGGARGGAGGFDTLLNDVKFAPIDENGNIGKWETTTSFSNTRHSHASTVYNGYLYVTGGWSGSTFLDDVQYAPISPDGSLGSWSTTTSLPSARERMPVAAHNGYMYVFGGYNSTYLDTVYRAPINGDGSLGSWTATGDTFAAPQRNHQAVIYNDHVYITGGWDGSDSTNEVIYAPINQAGSLGSWETTTSFPIARNAHASVAVNGNLYVIGGQEGNGSSLIDDVHRAPIHADGSVGAWSKSTDLPSVRAYLTPASDQGKIYVLGGRDGGDNELDDVYLAGTESVPREASYSKLIDLGSARNLTGISIDSSGLADYRLDYKVACSAEFGTSTSIANIQSGVEHEVNAGARYAWAHVSVNDSYNATFPDNGGSVLNSINLTYSSGHPSPDIRMRLGNHFQNNVKQPLDTTPEGGGSGGGSCSPVSTENYRYVRWEITERKGPDIAIQASEFELLLNGSPVIWPGGTIATNPGGSNPASEGPEYAIDGNTGTKWLDFNFSNDDTSTEGNSILDIDAGAGSTLTFDGYRWATANDVPDRDPITWNIYGSDNGTDWSLLDTRTQESITDDRNTYTGNYAL
ncbi:MAG: LamG-like jellyroll fold domain-containing protein [Candidatus Saccharibacteria bacterium]|nr:LamG-like jellyroll fold domain-containing protein [Candidatus Saccharibacteria bacterium]